MLIKKIAPFLMLLASAGCAIAQDAGSQTATAQSSPDPQQQQEEKAKLEKKAAVLLEQVVSEAGALKLPENRSRVQIAAGDMLWDRSPVRARGLLSDAGAMLSQMILEGDRTDRDEMQTLNQLRQDLVLTAGRHDAELGYKLLRWTQLPANTTNAAGGRRVGFDPQGNLEQNLLATIAATDPKVAYQKASEALDKGEYPTALNRVLAQLQSKDEEGFKKLSDKVLGRLASENLLTTREAASLALNLLLPGPRVTGTASNQTTQANTTNARNNSTQVLSESAYHDLLHNAVAAALNATSLTPGNNMRGTGPGGRFRIPPNQQPTTDDAQNRQNNARTLVLGLAAVLPQIDQYMPERSQTVRQKMTDLGMGNNPNMTYGNQMRAAMQQGTSETLEAAAKTAPPQMQSRLYQQAAQKAVDEGNTDRALQLANDHLDESTRNSIMQAVDFKRLTTTASAEKLDEIKQKLAGLPSDSDRVKDLIDLSTSTQKDNPKLALRCLDDARNLVNKRAANYKQFEDQLKVADAFAAGHSKSTL